LSAATNAFMNPHYTPWEQHFHPSYPSQTHSARFQHMYHHMYRRGPSRIFWFLIGGAAFAWFHHVKERKVIQAQQAQQEGRGEFTSCWYGPDRHRRWHDRQAVQGPPQTVQQATQTASQPKVDIQAQLPTDPWAEEKTKIKQVGQQASDAVADMAEVSLDGVLSAVETLRQKLAEHRAAREKLQSETPPDTEVPRRV